VVAFVSTFRFFLPKCFKKVRNEGKIQLILPFSFDFFGF